MKNIAMVVVGGLVLLAMLGLSYSNFGGSGHALA
jgi:hypothetical protein